MVDSDPEPLMRGQNQNWIPCSGNETVNENMEPVPEPVPCIGRAWVRTKVENDIKKPSF